MKIIVNTTSTYKGGGVQVANSFINECKKFDHDYVIVFGPSLEKILNQDDFPDNFVFYYISYRPATKVFKFKSDSDLKNIEKKEKPDVVFTTSGPAYWKPKAPHLIGYNLPHYIYKDSPFFKQITISKKVKWFFKELTIFYFLNRDSSNFVVQTDDVNQRLKSKIKKANVTTVSNTCSHYFREFQIGTDNQILPKKEDNEFRFLLLSAYYKHKNLEIIPKIIDGLASEYKKQIKFVITIDSDKFKMIFKDKYTDNVINIGRIPQNIAPVLYKECDAMFLPSLLECFSASYPEAMIMEKPIITTDLPFARSICGESALYYSPVNHYDAIEKIINLIEDKLLYKQLIENGKKRLDIFLTPEERAVNYLEICRELTLNG